jgi:hypothetical protein
MLPENRVWTTHGEPADAACVCPVSGTAKSEKRMGGLAKGSGAMVDCHTHDEARRSKCHPVFASKTTDFFNSFNNARDFTVSRQKGCRSHA